MPTQLFKKNIPKEFLFELLDKICLKNDREHYYLIDIIAYRKMLFFELYEDFKSKIKPYYNLSKQHYVDRKIDYNSFTNITRQICKSNNIMFTSKIKYSESKYNIEYYIYYSMCLDSSSMDINKKPYTKSKKQQFVEKSNYCGNNDNNIIHTKETSQEIFDDRNTEDKPKNAGGQDVNKIMMNFFSCKKDKHDA